MKKTKAFSILFIVCLLVNIIFSITANKVYAVDKNEVTLNFEGGIIHDGYVEYSKKAKLQLFKGEDLVADISNNNVENNEKAVLTNETSNPKTADNIMLDVMLFVISIVGIGTLAIKK